MTAEKVKEFDEKYMNIEMQLAQVLHDMFQLHKEIDSELEREKQAQPVLRMVNPNKRN